MNGSELLTEWFGTLESPILPVDLLKALYTVIYPVSGALSHQFQDLLKACF